jgi:hypothetical protein
LEKFTLLPCSFLKIIPWDFPSSYTNLASLNVLGKGIWLMMSLRTFPVIFPSGEVEQKFFPFVRMFDARKYL